MAIWLSTQPNFTVNANCRISENVVKEITTKRKRQMELVDGAKTRDFLH